MKKRLIIIGIALVSAYILLMPCIVEYGDGGTVEYRAILYNVTNYHAMKQPDGYHTGVRIEI